MLLSQLLPTYFYELLGSLSISLYLLTLADVSLCGFLSRILSVSGLWFPKCSKRMPLLPPMKADRPCFPTVSTQWGIVPKQEECLQGWELYLVATTNYHKLDALKQHKCLLLRFWKSRLTSRCWQSWLPLGALRGESISFPFPDSRHCW